MLTMAAWYKDTFRNLYTHYYSFEVELTQPSPEQTIQCSKKKKK